MTSPSRFPPSGPLETTIAWRSPIADEASERCASPDDSMTHPSVVAPELSVVVPVFNEEEALPHLLRELTPVLESLGVTWEILFVDDGSTDGTARLLQAAAERQPQIKVLRFGRNFGHQAAITAGLDFARGQAVVVMDADLQDPPSLLPQMLALFREGYDVVSPQRIKRDADTAFKRLSARWFYALMRSAVDPRLADNVSDFRLYSRHAVMAIRQFREQHRFLRGMVAWLGLREAFIPFERPARVAGETKFPVWKMLRFAWTAISGFSALPLKASLYAGSLLVLCGLLYGVYVVFESLVLRTTVPGWSSLVCIQLIFNGATLAAVGLMGDYIARIYDELKGRPLYVVADAIGLPHAPALPPRACVVHTHPGLAEPLAPTAPRSASPASLDADFAVVSDQSLQEVSA